MHIGKLNVWTEYYTFYLLLARGLLLLTGSSSDSNEAEVLTQNETIRCSTFNFPDVLYGVTGVLVGNSILTCGGTDYFRGHP